jgi:hypothetical protein
VEIAAVLASAVGGSAASLPQITRVGFPKVPLKVYDREDAETSLCACDAKQVSPAARGMEITPARVAFASAQVEPLSLLLPSVDRRNLFAMLNSC